MKRTWMLLVVLGALIAGETATGDEAELKGLEWIPTAPPAEGTPQGELALIRNRLAEGKPRKALKQAKKFLDRYPGHDGAEEAMNLAGQAQLDRGRYWKAYEWYDRQVSMYPMGPLFERALAREAHIANAFLAGKKRRWGIFRFDATEEGLEIHERLAEQLPGSRLAERSLMTVADYFYDHGRWSEAVLAYEHYEDVFQGRHRSIDAELKAAHATFNSFNGTEWDDTPLVDSQQRYHTFLQRYPRHEAAESISRRLSAIELDRAKKDYETAEFYIRVGRERAANFYYREVVRLYGGTVWADQARENLARN